MDEAELEDATDDVPFGDYVRRFGRLWDPPPELGSFVALDVHQSSLDQANVAVGSDQPRPVVVVGEHGSGKSAFAGEVARRAAATGMTVFEAEASEIAAGLSYIGQLERRIQRLAQEGRKRPVLWLLPELGPALTAGAFTGSPAGLLDYLMPYVERGEIRLLAEADPTSWAVVAQARPRVRAAAEIVRLPKLDGPMALTVARRWLSERSLGASESSLREALTLADDYLPAARPGNLIDLIKSAVGQRQRSSDAPEIGLPDLLGALSERTGLPRELLDPDRALDLRKTEGFFSDRVIGQPEAVEVVVERIALLKSGLTDPERPLGVFLFVGPTGTGKTELAKTASTFLFGSPTRLIRLDMSEYQTPDSLERLLGGPESHDSSGLIAAVREQPFAVVLLDEFEKAHPQIWDLFLQLLDDGRLTDRSGNVADFRHCLVIMTSNLGSASARSAAGFAPVGANPSEGRTSPAVRETFRPEFVNRIDKVVAFQPLSRSAMRLIVRKELGDVTRRRGLRTRPWAIEWEDSAVDWLLEKGFSSEHGARPLKRAIEDEVLAPLARAIVERRTPAGDQFVLVRAPGAKGIEVEFVDPDTEVATDATARPPPAELTVRGVALDPRGSPEEVQFLRSRVDSLSDRVLGVDWRVAKDERMQAMTAPGFWDSADRFVVLDAVEFQDRVEAGLETGESMMRRFARATRTGERTSKRLARLVALRVHVLNEALTAFDADLAPDAFLAVKGADRTAEAKVAVGHIVEMYSRWSAERGMRLVVLEDAEAADEIGEVRLAIAGFGAHPLLRHEAGLHIFETPATTAGSFSRRAVYVRVAPQPSSPADQWEKPAATAAQALGEEATTAEVIRRYREAPSPLVRDRRGWRTGRLDRVLAGDFDLFEAPGDEIRDV